MEKSRNELVVIDSNIDNVAEIVSLVNKNQSVIVLSKNNGFAELLDYLALNCIIWDAFHFITHGCDGSFILNSTAVSNSSLHADEWEALGSYLAPEGDILLYGCNIAASDTGKQLVRAIAVAANADISSSVDITGIGGNVTLEFSTGDIQTTSILPDSFNDVLESAGTRTVIPESSSMGITDTLFTKLYGTEDGGAILNSGTATVTNSTFSTNTAIKDSDSAYGGAVCNDENAVLEIKGSKFNSNTSTKGGAIYNESISFSVSESVFGENSAINDNAGGGAIYNDESATVSSSSFLNNSSDFNGGAIANYGTATVSACSFETNNASESGGAVYNAGTIEFCGAVQTEGTSVCVFISNEALKGGAIANCGTATVSACTFGTNNAFYSGGAVYNESSANVTISKSTFANNSAGNGGAVYNESSADAKITDSSFSNNFAESGGAVYNEDASLSFSKSNFQGNTAESYGGAVYNSGYNEKTAILSESTFSLNVSSDGGAVYNAATATVTQCSFTQNTTSNCGGAIYNDGNKINIIGSTFDQNLAEEEGGAVYISSGSVSIENSFFYANTATSGGAIYNNSGSEMVTVIGSTFSGNIAGSASGGAIYNDSDMIIKNSVFATKTDTIYNRDDLTIGGTVTLASNLTSTRPITVENNTTLSLVLSVYTSAEELTGFLTGYDTMFPQSPNNLTIAVNVSENQTDGEYCLATSASKFTGSISIICGEDTRSLSLESSVSLNGKKYSLNLSDNNSLILSIKQDTDTVIVTKDGSATSVTINGTTYYGTPKSATEFSTAFDGNTVAAQDFETQQKIEFASGKTLIADRVTFSGGTGSLVCHGTAALYNCAFSTANNTLFNDGNLTIGGTLTIAGNMNSSSAVTVTENTKLVLDISAYTASVNTKEILSNYDTMFMNSQSNLTVSVKADVNQTYGTYLLASGASLFNKGLTVSYGDDKFTLSLNESVYRGNNKFTLTKTEANALTFTIEKVDKAIVTQSGTESKITINDVLYEGRNYAASNFSNAFVYDTVAAQNFETQQKIEFASGKTLIADRVTFSGETGSLICHGTAALYNCVFSTANNTLFNDGNLTIGSTLTIAGNMSSTSAVTVTDNTKLVLDISAYTSSATAKEILSNYDTMFENSQSNLEIFVKISDEQSFGSCILATNSNSFSKNITVIDKDAKILTSLFSGDGRTVEKYACALLSENNSLYFKVYETSLSGLQGNKDGVSWSGNTNYCRVDYSKDHYGSTLSVFTTQKQLDTYGMTNGDYSWRVNDLDDKNNAFLSGENIAVSDRETARNISSNENGITDLFFTYAGGLWEAGYVAKHTGILNTWDGTGEKVYLHGKNKIADIVVGSSDANILVLTDDINGDALFVDDIFTALPDQITDPQARLSQINEIRAGAGNDIVDLTSARFEYIGSDITIRGGAGNDVIWANKGKNMLFGDTGNDRIIGAFGNDIIAGGSGNDILHGGGGEDIFTFCSDWGKDTVQQLEDGMVVLWFKENLDVTWDESTMTCSCGENSVVVSGVSADHVKIKCGAKDKEDAEQYATLTAIGGFDEKTSENIFETTKNILA